MKQELYRWEARESTHSPFILFPNERILIQGPSGSGKSRWMKRLIGLDPEFKDSILLRGQTLPTLELRKKVLWIPQNPVREPISILRWIQERRQHIAVNDDFEKKVRETLPQLEGSLDRSMTLLSGGELQAVILCFALAARPEVLLLDESTSAMDTQLKNKIETDLFGLDPAAIVWIRHDPPKSSRSFDRQITFSSS